MHDVVIRGGTHLDDDHSDAFAGDVAIDGNRIAQAGGKAGRAKGTSTRTASLSPPGRVDVNPLRGQAPGTQSLPVFLAWRDDHPLREVRRREVRPAAELRGDVIT